MDFNFEITPGGSSVPPGLYRATFERVQKTTHEEYGEGWKWTFKVVTDGEHAGEESSRTTGLIPKPKNACGRMVAQLAGQSSKPGVKLSPEDCVGKEYMIQVEEAPSGNGTRVATVMPRNV